MFENFKKSRALAKIKNLLLLPEHPYVNARVTLVDGKVGVHRVTDVRTARKQEMPRSLEITYTEPETCSNFSIAVKNITQIEVLPYSNQEKLRIKEYLESLDAVRGRVKRAVDKAASTKVRFLAHTDSEGHPWYIDGRSNFRREGLEHFTIVLHRDVEPVDEEYAIRYKCVYSYYGWFYWLDEFLEIDDPYYAEQEQRILANLAAVDEKADYTRDCFYHIHQTIGYDTDPWYTPNVAYTSTTPSGLVSNHYTNLVIKPNFKGYADLDSEQYIRIDVRKIKEEIERQLWQYKQENDVIDVVDFIMPGRMLYGAQFDSFVRGFFAGRYYNARLPLMGGLYLSNEGHPAPGARPITITTEEWTMFLHLCTIRESTGVLHEMTEQDCADVSAAVMGLFNEDENVHVMIVA